MGLLKFALPFSGAIGLVAHLKLLMDPDAFFKAFDLDSIGKEATESPVVAHLLFMMVTTRVAVNGLGVASFYYGSETRFRIGVALLFTQLCSMYAAYAKPIEYIVDSKGKRTTEFIPFDPMSKRFLVGMVMAVPLLIGLVVHLFEPGFFTTDKQSKDKKK